MAKQTIFHKFDRWIKQSWDFQIEQRQRADVSWDFVDGNQWTSAEIRELDKVNQAPSVVNILFPLLNAISSVETNRRTDYSIVPKEASDESLSNVLTQIVNQVFSENQVKFSLGRAFRSGLITGISWLEVYPEKDLDTDETIIRISTRAFEEFFYDPTATRYDLADARYISREVWMDLDIAQSKWGDKAEELRTFHDEMLESFHGREQEARYSALHSFVDGKGRIAVHDMYYKDATGKVKHVMFSGSVFLEGSLNDADNDSPYDYNYIPFIPYIAMWDKKGRPLGVIEVARSIQDSINKAHSKQHFLMASRGCVFEQGAFVNPNMAKQEWAKPNRWVPVTDGGLNRIREENNVIESQNLMLWIQFLIQTLQKIMGVNEATLGSGGPNARSAIQEQSRIAQGEGMQTPFIESLYFTKFALLKVVLKMVGQFYTEERVVRLMLPDGSSEFTRINSTVMDEESGEVFPFNKIPEIIRFDVDVKEELPFTNSRELNARTLSEVIKVAPGITPALIAPIIESLSGIQNKQFIVDQVKAMFQPQQNQPQ